MKMKKLNACRTMLALMTFCGVISVLVCGCGPKAEIETVAAKEAIGADVKPEDRPYFEAVRPFAEAVSARDYAKAYGYLSSHAKARMSPNQFVAPTDDATEAKNNAAVSLNPGPEQFARLMSSTEKEYGKPAKLSELDVYSTDRAVLSGKATRMEDKLDAMFAIGMMPDSIPANIRKASLRSRVAVELSSEQLAESAQAMGMTPEKLKADPDFDPSITLKMVVVEEGGVFKIGYFEFLPPGIWD